ncbi:MAG: hypothetical protein GY941_22640 [Planctomycetes bacterium]|nr:hypothetical protein [Planctomycetota bacterium]
MSTNTDTWSGQDIDTWLAPGKRNRNFDKTEGRGFKRTEKRADLRAEE